MQFSVFACETLSQNLLTATNIVHLSFKNQPSCTDGIDNKQKKGVNQYSLKSMISHDDYAK
jgi:hypothetical protein